MPYRKGGRKTWYTRVVARDGRHRLCSTGTTLRNTAKAVEAWHKDVRQRLDPTNVLVAIVEGRIPLAEAFALGAEQAHTQLQALQEAKNDTDLTPFLAAFIAAKRKARKGAASAPVYKKQIERLRPLIIQAACEATALPFVVEAPLRKSHLRVPYIAAALDALPVEDPTRNRYRAALSSFCRFLVRRGVLETNPAREAGGYPEGDGRDVWYEPDVAERIIQALPNPVQRGREAMLWGTGADMSDVGRLEVRDIDLDTLIVRCHGSKSRHRNRSIRITEGRAVRYIRDAIAGKAPGERAFPGGRRAAWAAHQKAVATVPGARTSTLHDWRHTYAVNALRRGMEASLVAHQLGHGNASLVWKTYGRFVPDSNDYKQAVLTGAATDPATHRAERRAGAHPSPNETHPTTPAHAQDS